jgi:CheY-like chemotaxis protein
MAVEAQCKFDRAKVRIAVIDDDFVFVELMRELLAEGEGYDVVCNPHWVKSYEFIKEHRPDLVILDLMMGREQTGWAVLELMRDDPTTALIPVILCSAAAPALGQHAQRCAGKGAVEAVSKPFDLDHLLHVIARLLEQRTASAVN